MKENEVTAMLLISKDQLRNIVLDAVKDAVSVAMQEANKMYEATPIKASEVTSKYGISSTTLWRWEKSGLLRCAKVGGRNYYKESDIKLLLNGESYAKV